MEYHIRETGQLVDYAGLLEACPNTYIPPAPTAEYLDGISIDLVQETIAPPVADTERLERDGAIPVEGGWGQAWKVVPRSPEEVAETLAAAKVAKRAEITSWKMAANQTTFPHLGKLIDCDADGRSSIDGVAGSITLTGSFPAGFQYAWKTADNSYIAILDLDAFRALYTSMTAQGTANFNRSEELKTQLASAVTLAEVAAIVW